MKNYYLKFIDQADLENTLISAGLASMQPVFGTENDTQFIPSFEITLDIIGLIYKPTGNTLTTEDGLQYPETLPIDGYHANLKAELTVDQEALLPLIPKPTTPYRVWAGE